MTRVLKQSTARNIIVVAVDSADHITGKTGLTLAVEASKNGGALASISPTVTERSDGGYQIALTSSHTDTLGDLWLHIEASGADPIDIVFDVRTALLDDIHSKTTNLPADPADASDLAAALATIASDAADGLQDVLDAIALGATASALSTAQTDLTTLIGRLTALRAGYLDNLSAGAVALASALSTAQTAITAIKAKTDSLVFTVANRVDATATLGTDAISAASVSAAAVTKIRDGLLSYSYASGRTVVGYIRRSGASLERATGLLGSTAAFLTQAGVEIWSITQSVLSGTRTTINLGSTEDPP